MKAETDINILLKELSPVLNEGEYVFCKITSIDDISLKEVLMFFKEEEGITVVIKKEIAEHFHLPYEFIASWITLKVYSSLNAVGLTAAFANALASQKISCNTVAAYHHDHIFVNIKDAKKAMEVLTKLTN
jgi:uncharacterized protein